MNYKQKKRIKDAAVMVKNVRDLSSNMNNISSEYAKDLESFFSAFVLNFSDKNESKTVSTALEDSLSLVPSQNNGKSKAEHKNSGENNTTKYTNRPERTARPLKIEIKQLYRKIMQKCHPDRTINDDSVTEEQKVLFAYVLDVAMAAYKKADTDDLIFAAALVDIYPQKTPMKVCLAKLSTMYTEKSKQIETLQNSLAWVWGTNWDTLEIRYQIIIAMCKNNNIFPPSKPDVLKFLVDFELD